MKHIVFFLLAVTSLSAFGLDGKVVGVHDGDTITVLDAHNQQHKIRLAEIDAPEIGQPWGANSKKALSDMVFSKFVQVNVDSVDRYGREVGTVFLNGVNVNYGQLKLGAAWAYTRYAKSKEPTQLQEMAERASVGLWSLPKADHTPPWEWRKQKKSENN